VAAAAKLDVLHRRLAASRERPHVVELDERALTAAPAVRALVRARAEIPNPHRTPHGRGYVARIGGGLPSRPWPLGSPELLPSQLGEQRGERTVEDRPVVSRGKGISQHVFGQTKLPERIAGNRQLKLVPILGEGNDGNAPARRGGSRYGGLRRAGDRQRRRDGGSIHPERAVSITRRRQCSDLRRDIRPRSQSGHDLLDVDLALAARGRKEAPVVLGREMRRQQPDARQAHGALRQHLEDHRESPDRARDLDSAVSLVLRERERLAAVSEERAIAIAEVDATHVERGEVRDELRGRDTLARGEVFQSGHEFVVREPTQRGEKLIVHVRFYHARSPGRDLRTIDCERLKTAAARKGWCSSNDRCAASARPALSAREPRPRARDANPPASGP
jgi:hypothetical protein